MDEERRRAYSEVIEVLKMIQDEERLTKIPFEVIEMIKNNSDPTYRPELSRDLPLDEQNLREETYGILGWIADKYWGENLLDQNENAEVQNTIMTEIQVAEGVDSTTANNIIHKEEIQEANNINKIEENEKEINVYSDIDPETIDKTLLPTVVSKPSLFKIIIEKISRFFRKVFKGVYEWAP